MPRASSATKRRAECLALIGTGMVSLAIAATACSGTAVPRAYVSPAQQTAISRFFVRNLWLSDGSHSVGCPADVLGAQHIAARLRVYTVVLCLSFTAKCANYGGHTEGLVADMAGSRVVSVLRDDSPDEDGVTAEAGIYPQSLRSAAIGYINDMGPSSLWSRAAKMAGCPHWRVPASWRT
jgi:hypothetical protein